MTYGGNKGGIFGVIGDTLVVAAMQFTLLHFGNQDRTRFALWHITLKHKISTMLFALNGQVCNKTEVK